MARGTARGLAVALLVIRCAPAAPHVVPSAPAAQLSLVTLDERATILSVDGLKPNVSRPSSSAPRGGIVNEPSTQGEFFVATGCRVLLVQYDATYETAGKSDAPISYLAAAQALATIESHHYSTMKPIRFLLPAKPGAKYWITASFTGEQFIPRIVELDAEGVATAHVEPDGKCP